MPSRVSHVQLFATPWTVVLLGSSVHGILQARILECVAMPSSRGSSGSRIEPASLMSPTFAGRWAFLVAQLVKNLPAMPETWV